MATVVQHLGLVQDLPVNPSSTWGAIIGPYGALAVLVLLILSIVWWKLLVPREFYEKALERTALLDEEAEDRNRREINLTKQNAEFRVELKGLRAEVAMLRKEVSRLRRPGTAPDPEEVVG